MRDLTQGNIHKTFLIFSIPIILSSMLQSAFGLVDTAMAGLLLGPHALAALGATNAFFGLIYSFFYGHAYGLSVYVGNMFGAKEYRLLKTSVQTNILLVLMVSVVVAALSILFYRPIFYYLNIEDAIWEDTKIYFFCLCIHLVVSMCSHFYLMCCNAVGVTTFPLIISIISSVLNIVGNYVSLAVLKWGVMGLGVSTILSTAVGFLCYYIRFRHYYREMDVHKIRVTPHWRYIARVLPASGSNIAQQISMYAANFIIAPLVNQMGYVALAVLAVGNSLRNWIIVFYNAAAKTGANYIAQCVGSHKYHLIRRAARTAFLHCLVTTLPIIALFVALPDTFTALFLQEGVESAAQEGVRQYIRILFPLALLQALCGVFHSIFRGIGSNHKLLTASLIGTVSSIISAFWLIPAFGILGYYWYHGISWALELLYEMIVYFSGHWVPSSIRKQVMRGKRDEPFSSSST